MSDEIEWFGPSRSERMRKAMILADKCWHKAYSEAPEFIEAYLSAALDLLEKKREVRGDEFRRYCASVGVRRPAHITSNVWVSGPRHLCKIGWVSPICKVEPQESHNHMPKVTLWKSKVFRG